jgi:hypothetical protein
MNTTDLQTEKSLCTHQKVLPAANNIDDCDDGNETEPSCDYDQDLTVAEVLDAIHLLDPSSNVLQYTRVLAHLGILYATSLTKHKHKYYVDTVGMPAALVDQMFDQTEKMAKGAVPRAAAGSHRLRREGAMIWCPTVKDLGAGEDIENLPAC